MFERFKERDPQLLELIKIVKVLDTEEKITLTGGLFEKLEKNSSIHWQVRDPTKDFLGKVEENTDSTSLKIFRLTKNALNESILIELGDKADILLSHFFALMNKQANGESGVLLLQHQKNIAYVRDKDEVLWNISCEWDYFYNCWFVFGRVLDELDGWGKNYQIISRG